MNKFTNSIILSALLLTATNAFAEGFDNTNILIEQAVNHIYNQRYKQAHSALKEAYEQSPRHPGVHFNLGRLFELTGNFEEALKEYRLASSLDKSMVAARRGMARCSVEIKKKTVTAQTVMPQALTAVPAVPEEPRPAKPQPLTVVPAMPVVQSVPTAPVVTQKKSNNQKQSVLPSNPVPASKQSNQSYQLPTVTLPRQQAPVVTQSNYTKQNDAVQTVKIYTSTSKLPLPQLPQMTTPVAVKTSETGKAEAKLNKGNTTGAIQDLKKILEKNENSAEAHYLMGKALSMGNDLFGSIKHLEEAIKVDEKCYEAYYLLGRNYAKVNLLDDSIRNYLIYYGVKPQATVATEIARVYETMGKTTLANDFYNKANSMNPGNSNLQMQVNESAVAMANDLYLRGNHAFSINQFREAASLLNQAISTNSLPDSARRDAVRKLEIARFRLSERDQMIAPIKQGFQETRKQFAPTSLKFYQLVDSKYKNNFTNAISVEWTGYIARRITRYGRDFLLMIKKLDRDELEYMGKSDNDYRLNKHFNNQACFLLMAPKGEFPNFCKEKVMITFNGKCDWQSYEIVNDMGATMTLPTFDFVSAFPVRR